MPDEYVDLEYDLHRVEADRGVLETAVRQLRAYARCITANKTEADELVEDSLMLFLAEDRNLRACQLCFAELLEVFRRVHSRAALIQTSRSVPEQEYAPYLQLLLPEREIAALVMGGGMSVPVSADLLGMPVSEAELLLQAVRRKIEDGRLPGWPFIAGASDGTVIGDDSIG